VGSTFFASQLHKISHLIPAGRMTTLKNIVLVLRVSKLDDASSKTIKDIYNHNKSEQEIVHTR
jgi:hypothetical protein